MKSFPVLLGIILLAATLGVRTGALAEASGPDFFRVNGVAAGDVLNIRAQAGADHAKVGEIPPNADGVRNLGCIGGLSFADWQSATADERTASAKTRWCNIEYSGVRGWVAARFLGEGSAPAGVSWRVVEVGENLAHGDADIGFRSDGSFYGSTGCNRFQGQAGVEEGVLLLSGPIAATRMACAGEQLGTQERAILAILNSNPWIQYDPVADEMTLFDSATDESLRATRRP